MIVCPPSANSRLSWFATSNPLPSAVRTIKGRNGVESRISLIASIVMPSDGLSARFRTIGLVLSDRRALYEAAGELCWQRDRDRIVIGNNEPPASWRRINVIDGRNGILAAVYREEREGRGLDYLQA